MQKIKDTRYLCGVLPQASSWPRVRGCLVKTPKMVHYLVYVYFMMFLLCLSQPCLYSVLFGSMIKLDIMFNLIKLG
jgi:hypothetical protein